MHKIKCCLSGRVFEDQGAQTISLERFFALAAESGFTGVELRKTQLAPDSPPEIIAGVNTLTKTYGLPVELITMRGRKLDADADFSYFEKYLELAVHINCARIKVSGNNVKLLRKAAAQAEKLNIKVATNNHVNTPLESVSGTAEFLKSVDHPNFHLLFDPSHLWLNREAVTEDFIREILSKISFVIFQDYLETDDTESILIGKRRIVPVQSWKTGDTGYPEIVNFISTVKPDIPLGLVRPGAIRNSNEGKAWIANWKQP